MAKRKKRNITVPNIHIILPKWLPGTLIFIGILLSVISLVMLSFQSAKSTVITLGLNGELSGSLSAVGKSSQQGAQMAISHVNDHGGIQIGGNTYTIRLDIQDNASTLTGTSTVAKQLITDGVSAIIGPNASAYANQASVVSEKNKTLMISPWSTDPQTSFQKRYVYRVAFLNQYQAEALALFAKRNLKVTRAAIFYDQSATVLKQQASSFQKQFTKNGGSILTTQSFTTGATNFYSQLQTIQSTTPQIIFLPAYYSDAAAIIQQARQLGITAIFLGSDAWGGQQILTLCGQACEGIFMSSHFAVDAKTAKTVQFVKDYQDSYHMLPDDVAALTFDAVNLAILALQHGGDTNQAAAALGMAEITSFTGVTGSMLYTPGSGDPKKSVYILEVTDQKLHVVNTRQLQ